MKPEIFENIIKIVNQLVDFNEEEMFALLNKVEIVQLKKKDVFIHEGEIANSVAFTNKGYLRVYYNHDGEDITRDITPLHSFVTALSSFVHQVPSFEIIDAITDCELLILSKNDIDYLCESFPKMERLYRRIIEELFVESQGRIYSFITETAETRYKKLVKQYPDMIFNVPIKYIADFLGVKSQSLSRLRGSLD